MTEVRGEVPRIALLGVTSRARYHQASPLTFPEIDLLGLTKAVMGFVYPLELSAFVIVLAIYNPEASDSYNIVVRDDNGKEVYTAKIAASVVPAASGDASIGYRDLASGSITYQVTTAWPSPSWHVVFFPFKGLVLEEPSLLRLFLVQDGADVPLGALVFGLLQMPPLTPDRIAAIKSDPRAVKGIRMDLGCKVCPSKLKVFAGLEKPKSAEEGVVWYQDIPDSFNCSCGATRMKLDILRSNMHALLGQTEVSAKNVSYTRVYEDRSLGHISHNFLKLIEREPREEDVQEFIAGNPIVFHFLAPMRLFEKPPILSKHKTDFVILDGKGTLTFVEIERPNIRLLRKDGATSADMDHAISQVRDWLYEYEKHRAAVLDCLGLQEREVTKVRGLVIAGRDKGYSPEALRKFKWQDRGKIECMTYDDLLSGFAALGGVKHFV